jgi:hypothetical protein
MTLCSERARGLFKIVLFITAVLVQDYPARGDITGHYYASGNALDGLKKVQTV